jgi:Helicase conserved C-terminal domain/SNF2-related domain
VSFGRIAIRRIESGKGLYAIKSGYFSRALVDAAQTVPGVRYDAQLGWYGYADAIQCVVDALDAGGINVDGSLPMPGAWKESILTLPVATHGTGELKLRPYQQEGVKFLVAQAAEGCLLADGMRLGKTAQSTVAARAFREKTLVVCPPQVAGVWGRPPDHPKPGEIAKWWPDAWRGLDDTAYRPNTRKDKHPQGVVILEGVEPDKWQEKYRKLLEIKEAKRTDKQKTELAEANAVLEDFGKELQNAIVVVAHSAIVYAWTEVLLRWGVRTLIIDECFPAGTLVDTPSGPQAIETLREGDPVFNALGQGVVEKTFKNETSDVALRLIELDDGRAFIVTLGHPVLTSAGWTPVALLEPGATVLDLMYTHKCGNQEWDQPQGLQGPKGPQEPQGPRVVHVTVPERADFERLGLCPPNDQGRLQVYNIQVSGHPSYSVAGLVVHNCHDYASYDTRRSLAVKEIAASAVRKYGLSGTPMTSRPRDLHNVVDILCPGRLGVFFREGENNNGTYKSSYGRMFCGSFQKTVGSGPEAKVVWDHSGKSNMELLKKRLSYFMLRRVAKEVDPQLPAKTRQIVDVKIPAGKMITPTMDILKDKAHLRRVLDLAADGKMAQVVSIIKGHIEEGEKVLVFCHRRNFAESIVDSVQGFEDCGATFVHGELPRKERDARIMQAERATGPFVFACTIESCSTGIDLSFASVVVFAELVWEPGDIAQAEERVYTVGSGKKAFYQYIIARGTGDELILRTVIEKLDDFETIIGTTGDGMKVDLAKKRRPEDALAALAEALLKMNKATGEDDLEEESSGETAKKKKPKVKKAKQVE